MKIEARRSIFSRIVLAAIGLSVVLVLALWFVTHQTIGATLDEGAQKEIDVDIAGLVDIYATGGLPDLQQRIADRIALTPSEGNTPHYLLANDAGKVIAGDLARWPDLDPMISESGRITLGENSEGFARAVQLGPDLRMTVARRIENNTAVLDNVALAFGVGGAVFVLLVALLGRIAAIGLQRRIGEINLAFRDPEKHREELSAFSPVENADEIDELTAHSAAALTRQRSLMEAYKETSEQLAHEMRTPLSHLDNRLIKALEAGPSPEVGERLVEARTEIRRLVQTLESLLDIAASKTRRGDRAGLEPVDFSDMVARICELYAGSAEETGYELVWDVEPGVIVDGDGSQLSRLVTNLLDNALKYVPPGGRIAVSLAAGPVLVVADNGPGIAPADRARIFERFYRGRSNPGSDEHGSGLGLALARAIAERHGLTLNLDDTDRGASFRLQP